MSEINLSVEETNKLRLSLGLSPLEPTTGEATQHKQMEAKNADRQRLVETIRREKEAVARQRILDGTGLPIASTDKSTEKRSYSSADLSGLRVSHDMDDLLENGEAVLVLKDSTIMENEEEGDELISIVVAEKEQLRRNLDNRTKKPGYSAYDEDEAQGVRRSILYQYDEEEDRIGFVLGSKVESKQEPVKMNTVSLNYDKTKEITDYYTKEELVAFRKPKKPKKNKKRKPLDDDMPEIKQEDTESIDAMDTSFSNSNRTENVESINFVDDDDLQLALARARKQTVRKKLIGAEKAIDTLLSTQNDTVADDGGGLVISDTSEFVNNLDMTPSFLKPTNSVPEVVEELVVTDAPITSDVQMEELKEEEEELKMDEIDEPLVSNGLAATLSLLNQRGLMAKVTEEELKRDEMQKKRRKWLIEQRKVEVANQKRLQQEKEKRRQLGHSNNGRKTMDEEDERLLERQMRDAERIRIRELEERFKNYTPDINLKYFDDSGFELKPKEAFKHLAHRFHGNDSGKNKMGKKLRMRNQELLLKQMGDSETPLGLNAALSDRMKQKGEAFVTLSVGNRAAGLHSNSNKPLPENATRKPHTKKQNAGTTIVEPAMNPTGAQHAASLSAAPVVIESIVGKSDAGSKDAQSDAPKRERISFGLSIGGAKRKAEDTSIDTSSSKKRHQ